MWMVVSWPTLDMLKVKMRSNMRLLTKLLSLVLVLALLGACTCNKAELTVSVSNPTNEDRLVETVRVELGELATASTQMIVVEQKTAKEMRSQLIDEDKDGQFEAIIFQAQLKANETRNYELRKEESTLEASQVRTFGRFVPERTDDFTWENDKVAFRVYGPEAQRMVEQGEPGGTLSGGVDCWLKKVDYSIIDKWYKGNLEEPGYYHIDHGEGLDNYHVGPSLGCGGTGVMVNNELHTSLNYTGYDVIANGPIETKFALQYDAFGAENQTVQQSKTVSINLGNNLTKFTIEVEGTDVLTTGVTLHENQGETNVDSLACWGSYWAPHFGEELGTAIVVDPKYYNGYTKVVSDVKDKSHLLMHLNVIDGKVEYYAGFAWSGSKQVGGKEEWHQYLNQFAKQLQTPLDITVQ